MIQIWGVRISTLLLFTLLARTLSPDEIGTVGYVLGLLAIFQVFADLGLAEYLVYNHKAARNMQLAVWWLQVGLAILISLALSLIVTFGFMSEKNGINDVMMALIWTIPISTATRVPEALMRKDLMFREIALRSFVAITAGGIVGVILAFKGAGVWSLVAKQWVEVIVDMVMLFGLSRWRPAFTCAFSDSLLVLRHSWGIVWSRLLDIIMQKADVLIIGTWIGIAELGYYTIGQKMFQVLYGGFVGALASVFCPKYGRLREDKAALKAFFLSSVQGASLLITPIFLLASFIAPEFIRLIFGVKWAESAQVMRLMCLSGLLLGAVNLNGFLVLAMQKNLLFSVLMSVGFVVTILLMLAAAPYGINALAATGLIETLILFPIGLIFVMRLLDMKLSEYFRNLEPTIVIVALIASVEISVKYWFDFNPVFSAIYVCTFTILLSLITLRFIYWKQIKNLHVFVLGK